MRLNRQPPAIFQPQKAMNCSHEALATIMIVVENKLSPVRVTEIRIKNFLSMLAALMLLSRTFVLSVLLAQSF